MNHLLIPSSVIASNSGQMALLLAPLVLISLALTVTALIDLARRETVRGSKLLWVIVILLVGTLGPIAYLIFGRKEV